MKPPQAHTSKCFQKCLSSHKMRFTGCSRLFYTEWWPCCVSEQAKPDALACLVFIIFRKASKNSRPPNSVGLCFHGNRVHSQKSGVLNGLLVIMTPHAVTYCPHSIVMSFCSIMKSKSGSFSLWLLAFCLNMLSLSLFLSLRWPSPPIVASVHICGHFSASI